MSQELSSDFIQTMRLIRRVLQEAMVRRDDTGSDIVDTDSQLGFAEGIGGMQARCVGDKGLVQVVADDGGFDEGFGAGWCRAAECWN